MVGKSQLTKNQCMSIGRALGSMFVTYRQETFLSVTVEGSRAVADIRGFLHKELQYLQYLHRKR